VFPPKNLRYSPRLNRQSRFSPDYEGTGPQGTLRAPSAHSHASFSYRFEAVTTPHHLRRHHRQTAARLGRRRSSPTARRSESRPQRGSPPARQLPSTHRFEAGDDTRSPRPVSPRFSPGSATVKLGVPRRARRWHTLPLSPPPAPIQGRIGRGSPPTPRTAERRKATLSRPGRPGLSAPPSTRLREPHRAPSSATVEQESPRRLSPARDSPQRRQRVSRPPANHRPPPPAPV